MTGVRVSVAIVLAVVGVGALCAAADAFGLGHPALDLRKTGSAGWGAGSSPVEKPAGHRVVFAPYVSCHRCLRHQVLMT